MQPIENDQNRNTNGQNSDPKQPARVEPTQSSDASPEQTMTSPESYGEVEPSTNQSSPQSYGSESASLETSLNPTPSNNTPSETELSESAAPTNIVAGAGVGASMTNVGGNDTTGSNRSQPVFSANPGAQKPKRSKMPFVIGGIIGGLILLSAGAFATYRAYQSPEKVLRDAVTKAVHAKAVQMSAVVTSDAKVTTSGQTIAFKKFTFDAKSTYDPKSEANATATIAFNGNDYNFAANGMMSENGEVYFKIVKAVDSVQKFYETMANGQKIPADARSTFRSLEGKWVKVSIEDMTGKNKESADAYKCVLDAYKSYGQDKKMQDEVVEVYKKHSFIKTKGGAKYKDGMLGYEVTVDEALAKEFGKAARETSIAKKVTSCDKDTSKSTDSVKDSASEVTKETTAVTHVWVDPISHELKKIDSSVKYSPKNGEASTTVAVADFGFDQSVKIDIPASSMTLDEFMKKIQQGYQQASGVSTSDIEGRANDTAAETMANMVAKKAEAYNAINSSYPASIADFEKVPESRIAEISPDLQVLTSLPVNEKQVAYKKCSSGNSAQVVYKKSSDNTFVAIGVGGAPSGPVTKLCD